MTEPNPDAACVDLGGVRPALEPDPAKDPQWQCSGCGNWWAGNRVICDLCGKTVYVAKVKRGECPQFTAGGVRPAPEGADE